MSNDIYYPGVFSIDLKSGKYDLATESFPSSLSKAEDKFEAFLSECRRRGLTMGHVGEYHKPNLVKEVMVIENDIRNYAFISDVHITTIEPWQDVVKMDTFSFDIMNQSQKSNRDILTKVLSLAKKHPIMTAIVLIIIVTAYS